MLAIFLYVLTALGVVLAIVAKSEEIAQLFRKITKKEEKYKEGLYVKKSRKKVQEDVLLVKWKPYYVNLSKIQFIKTLLDEIAEKYSILLRGNIDLCKAKAANYFVTSVRNTILTLSLYFILSPSVYSIITALILSIASYMLKLRRDLETLSLQLKVELDQIITKIKFYYSAHGNILRALEQAAIESKGIIKEHVMNIVDTLRTEQTYGVSDEAESDFANAIEVKTNRYLRLSHNKHIKRLFSLCVTSIQYGEDKLGSENTFLDELTNLREDLIDDIDFDKKHGRITKNNVIVTVVPLLLILPLSAVTSNLISGMEVYFTGIYSVIGNAASFIVSIAVFIRAYKDSVKDASVTDRGVIIGKIADIPVVKRFISKYYYINYSEALRIRKQLKRSGSRETEVDLFVSRCLYSAVTYIVCLLLLFSSSSSIKNVMSQDFAEISSMTINYSAETNRNSVAVHSDLLLNYSKNRNLTVEDITELYAEVLPSLNKALAPTLAQVTHTAISKVNNVYVRWWMVALVILLSVGMFSMPMKELKRKEKLITRRMADETIQLQAILSMLVCHESMTPKEILKWLERFSDIFKPGLSKALSELTVANLDNTEFSEKSFEEVKDRALVDLLASEEYEPFRRVITSLIAADRIGIQKAYIDINVEKKAMQKERSLDNEIKLSDLQKALLNYQLIPFFIVVVCFFMAPLILYSVSMSRSALDLMNSIGV